MEGDIGKNGYLCKNFFRGDFNDFDFMKRILLCIIVLLTVYVPLHAQHEIQTDSVALLSAPNENPLPTDTRNYGGFLIDMELMNLQAAPAANPLPLYGLPNVSRDFSRLFQLNPDITYSQGLSHLFTPANSFYSINPFGLSGFWWSSPVNLQMGSFRLNNGLRINTYGEYNKEGWKVSNPSALPWERNNFKGAFELKSANGSFGIRIEVQQGRGGLH